MKSDENIFQMSQDCHLNDIVFCTKMQGPSIIIKVLSKLWLFVDFIELAFCNVLMTDRKLFV